MDPTSRDAECATIRDDLAALALGTLTGRDRARILAHLEGCVRCTTELEELSAAADALISLVPEATPSEGFATHTTARMRAERRRRSGPAIRRLTAVAAIVVAVGLGIGLGTIISSPGGSGPTVPVLTAALHSRSGAHGTVVLSTDHDGWLIMTLDDAPTSGRVTCAITLADGSRRIVGQFELSAGYGSWAAPLPVAASSVRSVVAIDRHGATVASAHLPP